MPDLTDIERQSLEEIPHEPCGRGLRNSEEGLCGHEDVSSVTGTRLLNSGHLLWPLCAF